MAMYRESEDVRCHARRVHRAVAVLVLVVVLGCAGFALYRVIGQDIEAQQRVALKDAVDAAAVQCFALEGAYPDSLEYLEERYGLRVNHDEYIVTYSSYASNVLPEVEVLKR